jgi:hypothetical protein
MPRFDGTGPRGGGPMTGRGEGYCIVELPEAGGPARGYAGLQADPVRLDPPATRPARPMSPLVGLRRLWARGRGLAACGRRGRRGTRW